MGKPRLAGVERALERALDEPERIIGEQRAEQAEQVRWGRVERVAVEEADDFARR